MDTMIKIGFVAAGGALGAVARHLINVSSMSTWFERFPFPTFFINVIGSFLIGFCLILLNDRIAVSESVRLGIMVGFLGAFTTFSTFEAEIYGLLHERQVAVAMVYMLLSLLLGFLGLIAGISVGKKLW